MYVFGIRGNTSAFCGIVVQYRGVLHTRTLETTFWGTQDLRSAPRVTHKQRSFGTKYTLLSDLRVQDSLVKLKCIYNQDLPFHKRSAR
jgi:hypothetical protein